MKSRILIGLLLIVLGQKAQAQGEYQFLKSISIGGQGGWDLLSIDSRARKLYVTHSSKVVIVDLDSDMLAGEIGDTPGVHGFAIAPELSRGFSSNGAEARVSVVDLKTLKTLSKVETGENPDAILYEPSREEVYAFNGRGQSATVIDAKTAKVITTVPLPGKPEVAAADERSGRVFCNIEDKSAVTVIDAKSHAVVATWPLMPGEEPTGMAIDAVHHRLFVGCHNKMMAMLDTDTGKVVATVPIGAGVDGCAFDDATQLAFASCGDGTTTIAKEETPQKLTVVQALKTEPRARTMALDPQTHRIYLPSAQFQPATTPAPGSSPARPTIVPNTLKLLVYQPGELLKP
jgi:YVTN family beta-propeller protein